jgi:DNA-binding NtrC family response regulator
MGPLNVVVFQNDSQTAERLAASLSKHFPSILLTNRREEIRGALASSSAAMLVLDLETSGTEELERLHREFPALSIVCTHRLANDQLWTETLNQGAADLCVPWNTQDVVRSLTRERARRDAA